MTCLGGSWSISEARNSEARARTASPLHARHERHPTVSSNVDARLSGQVPHGFAWDQPHQDRFHPAPPHPASSVCLTLLLFHPSQQYLKPGEGPIVLVLAPTRERESR